MPRFCTQFTTYRGWAQIERTVFSRRRYRRGCGIFIGARLGFLSVQYQRWGEISVSPIGALIGEVPVSCFHMDISNIQHHQKTDISAICTHREKCVVSSFRRAHRGLRYLMALSISRMSRNRLIPRHTTHVKLIGPHALRVLLLVFDMGGGLSNSFNNFLFAQDLHHLKNPGAGGLACQGNPEWLGQFSQLNLFLIQEIDK